MNTSILAIALVLVISGSSVNARPAFTASAVNNKVVCYFDSWADYRPTDSQFVVEDIIPTLCTHMVYAFAGIDPYNFEIVSLDINNDLPEFSAGYTRFSQLASKYGVIPMLAVGGPSVKSTLFSDLAADYGHRQVFIESATNFIIKYGFRGIDINWQYPTQDGGRKEDRDNFVSLLRELKGELAEQGFYLSATISGRKDIIDLAYDVPNVDLNVHFLNTLAFDYHDDWGTWTGANSPIYPHDVDPRTEDVYFNVNYTVNYLISQGATGSKFVLGMPAHGHTFLSSSSPAVGNVKLDTGVTEYFEICEAFLNPTENWTIIFDPVSLVPFASYGDEHVSYDNIESITDKSQFVLSNKLAGGMLYAIDEDDFKNRCGDGAFPLLTAINDVLRPTYTTVSRAPVTTEKAPSTAAPTTEEPTTTEPTTKKTTTRTTTQTTTTKTTTKSTTQEPTTQEPTTEEPTTEEPTTEEPTTVEPTTEEPTTESPFKTTGALPETTTPPSVCQYPGYQADPNDCSIFYDCVPDGDGYDISTYRCSNHLVFNPYTDTCDYPDNVPDCHLPV